MWNTISYRTGADLCTEARIFSKAGVFEYFEYSSLIGSMSDSIASLMLLAGRIQNGQGQGRGSL